MYEARQNKEKVSRQIGKSERKSGQRFSIKGNKTNIIPVYKTIQCYTLSRENLRDSIGQVPNFGNYTPEAHHIIPVNLIERSYRDGDTDDGICKNYDSQWNGIFLPATPTGNDDNRENNGSQLPYHRNRVLNHNTYDAFVEEKLNGAGITDLKSDNLNIQQVAGQIRGIIINMGGRACLDEIRFYSSSLNHSTEQYPNRRKPEPREATPRDFSRHFKFDEYTSDDYEV